MRGWFWPTRTPAMNGSSLRTLPTSSRNCGLSSRPSTSITRRDGFSATKWRSLSAASDSIVMRVYSSAGQTRTATIAAPKASWRVPRASANAPIERRAARRDAAVMAAAPGRAR